MYRNSIVAATWLCCCLTVFGQTTEFTYQGSLAIIGAPASGNFDFEFALFDSPSAGTQLGSTIPRNAVVITNGTFAAKLDFGSQFPGANRYLEIRVRNAGSGSFTPLLPRQQINSSPYSIKSTSAESAANATTAAKALQLGGVAANQYLLTNGNGSALTNLNAGSISTGTLSIANGGTGSATKNFVDLSTDQNSIGGNKNFVGNLTVNGNLGLGTNIPAGKFHINVPGSGTPISALTLDVGTFGTGANAVNSYFFKVRDVGAGSTPTFLIRGDGNVGIGTAAPASKLHVFGGGGLRITADSDSNAGFGLRLNNASKWSVATVSPGQFQIFNDAIGQNAVWIDNTNNNVGIGTTAPSAKLEVNGDIKVSGTITGPRTTMSLNTASIVPGSTPTAIPGLAQTINVSGNAKLLIQYRVKVEDNDAFNATAWIDLVTNSSTASTSQQVVGGLSVTYISGSWLMSVGAGAHTVEIKASSTSGTGIALAFGGFGTLRSNLIVQVIPE